jgi:putative ABC transport system substrate-binding protein
LGTKWVELIKEIAPQTTRVALLFNPATATGGGSPFVKSAEVATKIYSMESAPMPVRDDEEIERRIQEFAKEPNGGLIVMPDVFVIEHRKQIIASVNRYKLPSVFFYRYFVDQGGLSSYGINIMEAFRASTKYVDVILKGTRPDQLPVQVPSRFEMVINLRTARQIGLEVSPLMLARAHDVIE